MYLHIHKLVKLKLLLNCKNRIKHLEDRILKKQPRPKYDNSKFVVYLASK
jgi:hypothetical protein